MKNTIQKTTTSVRKFVADHKVGLSVVATAVITTAACAKLSRIATEHYDNFIEEHGLTEAFEATFADED